MIIPFKITVFQKTTRRDGQTPTTTMKFCQNGTVWNIIQIGKTVKINLIWIDQCRALNITSKLLERTQVQEIQTLENLLMLQQCNTIL